MPPKKTEFRTSYVTIEKVGNGFLVIIPERGAREDGKWFKSNLNGVLKLLEETFDVKAIRLYAEEKTETTIDTIIGEKND